MGVTFRGMVDPSKIFIGWPFRVGLDPDIKGEKGKMLYFSMFQA